MPKLLSSFLLTNCLFFFFILVFPSSDLSAQRTLLDKKQSTTCLDRSFTLMVHITRDTFGNVIANPDNIQDAIDLVNLWFEPICVSFHIEKVDTIDNFQYNVPENNNELQQIWNNHNADNRINLYVIQDLSMITYEPVYATPEGILNNSNGGIIITNFAAAIEPLWAIHAFGHYCGLLNTNNDWGEELVNGDNCEITGDQICDTPADPQDPFAPFEGLNIYYDIACHFIYLTQDPNGEYYVAQTGNAMSNYPTSCWCGLTFGQFERMAEVIGRSRLWE